MGETCFDLSQAGRKGLGSEPVSPEAYLPVTV